MSIRLEMLAAASRAPQLLGESTSLIRQFLLAQQNEDGGFKDRAGQSDLYYLPFALGGLAALAAAESRPGLIDSDLEHCARQAIQYLTSFGAGANLDFVHLCSLARGWATALSLSPAAQCSAPVEAILDRLGQHRTQNGGYHPVVGSSSGSAYGAFLAVGAFQDLGLPVPEAGCLADSLAPLKISDGGYTNEISRPEGSACTATNPTAAAVVVLRQLGQPMSASARDWLLARMHPGGGFLASPTAPAPDLLSTATALYALSSFPPGWDRARERCLDFIDSLWTNSGAFSGHWADEHLDCEYTFYGLLALGRLAAG